MTERDSYVYKGVELQPLYDLMNRHLVIRRSSISGCGDLARALVDAGWEQKKAEARAATVTSDSSEVTVDVNPEALIIAAFAGTGHPITSNEAIRAAAGWHPDYAVPSVDWDPWRDAFRELVARRRVVKEPSFDVGSWARWSLSAGETP